MVNNIEESRKECQKSRTRAKIVTAAIEEFSTKGVSGVPFDSIAQKADIARRTLYYHFRSKNELLHAIIDPRLEAAIAEIRKFRDKQAELSEIAIFCLRFWKADPFLSVLSRRLKEEKIFDFSVLQNQFLNEFKMLLSDMKEKEKLRFEDENINIRLIFFSLFPLLEIISTEHDYEQKFINIFITMLSDNTET